MTKIVNADCGCEKQDNLLTKLQLKTTPEALLEKRPLTEVEMDAIEEDLGKLGTELEAACAAKETELVAFLQDLLKRYEIRIVADHKAKQADFRKGVVATFRRMG